MSPNNSNGVSNGVSSAPALPLESLSWTITKTASIVSQHLAANHLPQPSLDADGPSTVVPNDAPENVQRARQNLMAAALEIFQLAAGPSEFLPNLATGFQYISCLAWLSQHRIFHLVPLDAPITYAALSTASGVSVARLKSVLRMAMTASLFRESSPSPDGPPQVAHSCTSAHLARNADAYAYATWMHAGSAPVALQMAAAAARWGPDSTRPTETAFSLALNTELPFFEHLARDPAATAGFAGYMRSVRSSDGVALRHLVKGFDWAGLVGGALVVDVGGSTGGAAVALAEAFPRLRVVVQDLPANAESGRKMAAEGAWAPRVAERVEFQAHDFLQPQPVKGADVYLLRMILHDWPDEMAVKIVRNLVDAMEGGSRLLIMDTVLPDPGSVPVSVERIVRVRDLTMLQAFNSKERDLEDWKHLLALVDPALELAHVVQPFGSAMSVLEVVRRA